MKTAVWLSLFLFINNPGQPAQAYLDPGTGAMLLQIILGGVAGALVAFRLYWHRFRSFIGLASATTPSRDDGEAKR